MEFARGRLVALKSMINRFRQRAQIRRAQGELQMRAGLIDDCERLANARRELACNDNGGASKRWLPQASARADQAEPVS